MAAAIWPAVLSATAFNGSSEELAAAMETAQADLIQLLSPAELEVEKVRVTAELRQIEIACGD